jgi:coenzyme F420-reducing hydrogenase delta subunit
MKINMIARMLGLVLAVSVASVSASDKVTNQSGRDLRVTVYDTHVDKEVRLAVLTALNASLTASLVHDTKSSAKVICKAEDEPAKAAKDLTRGACDAVIVIGSSVPEVFFKKGDFTILKADSRSKILNRTFYLVGHATRDVNLNQKVGQVFDQALRSASLQEVVAGKSKSAAGIAATP